MTAMISWVKRDPIEYGERIVLAAARSRRSRRSGVGRVRALTDRGAWPSRRQPSPVRSPTAPRRPWRHPARRPAPCRAGRRRPCRRALRSALRTSSTALKREVRSARDADHDAGLAVLGDADDGDHAGADLLLAVVDQALEVLGLDALDRARQQLDAAGFAHAGGRRRPPTGSRRRPSRASCARPTDRARASCALPSGLRCAPACRRPRCEARWPRSSPAPWSRWRACARDARSAPRCGARRRPPRFRRSP